MNSNTLASTPSPQTIQVPVMVSEVRLDLTGIGERIALELKDALRDLRLIDCVFPTAADIAQCVGKVIKKRLGETRGPDEESQKSISQLTATSLVQTQILSTLIDAVHKKQGFTPTTEDLDDDSTASEVHDETGLDATSLREMTMMHAMHLWDLTHEHRSPSKMRIVILEAEAGSQASVVYLESKTEERSCVGNAGNWDCAWKGAHTHTYKILVNKPYLQGAVSSSDLAALQSLYAQSKERLGAVSIGENVLKTG